MKSLRGLAIPLMGFKNYASESDAVLYEDLVRTWTEDFGAFMFVVVPGDAQNVPDDTDRIKYLKEGKLQNWYLDHGGGIPVGVKELFNPIMGRYQIDFLVTSRSSSGSAFTRDLYEFRAKDAVIPVIYDEPKVVAIDGAQQMVTDNEFMMRSLSYALGYTKFDTEFERKQALVAARYYLQPHMVKRIMDRSTVIPLGVSCDEIDRLRHIVKKRDRFTLFFGGRFNFTAKRIDHVVQIMDWAFSTGMNCDVVLSSPKMESFGRSFDFLEGKKNIEIHTDVRREKFYELGLSSHVYVNASRYEGFTVGFVEQLYMGMVGIVPNKEWVATLLGECWDSYPFKYDTDEEAFVLLKRVYKDYDKALKQMEPIREYIRRAYTNKTANAQFYEWIVEKVNVHQQYSFLRNSEDSRVAEALKKTVDEMPNRSEFTLIEFFDRFNEKMMTKLDPYSSANVRGKPSLWHIRQWLMAHGYRDVCDSPIPRFVLEVM